MGTTALFAGTFDPFTLGHDAIVRRALAMFGSVVVAVGRNIGKECMLGPDERSAAIEAIYKDDDRVRVVVYDNLTMDFAREVGATVLVRGVRSVSDFEYERNIADVNMLVGGIDTVLLVSEPRYAAISSSVVRELMKFGKDVSEFLP